MFKTYMKALICNKISPPDALEWMDIEPPNPKTGEVQIKVMAVGVNFRDTLIIEDKYQFKAMRPFAPCGEVSGVISAIGEGVKNFKTGEAVFVEMTHGGLAEYAIAKAVDCYKMPNDIDFATAAATSINYGTAYFGILHKGRAQSGETILVTGAAGATGLAAIKIAKALGLKVIATASSDEKLQIAINAGADWGFVTPRLENNDENKKIARDYFKEKLGDKKPDLIFDTIGGVYAEAALRCINWGGRFLVVGFTSGIPTMPLNLTLVKACEIIGVFYTSYAQKFPEQHQKDLEIIFSWLKSGTITPNIDKVFDFHDAIDALNHIKGKDNQGKTIIRIGNFNE